MSNHLAIAAVTAALKRHLQAALNEALSGALSGAKATSVSPQKQEGLPVEHGGVNVYLYQVTPNVARRNQDGPTRTASGALIQAPRVSLDLHYLLTFYDAPEAINTSHSVLAVVARRLHAEPCLPRATLALVEVGELATSTLQNAPDLVRFTPTHLSLEETSKLWSVMLQTPYVLSLAYVATQVTIEVEAATPSPLPVQRFNALALPFSEPIVEEVRARAPADPPSAAVADPIVAGMVLVLRGKALAGDRTWVRIDGVAAQATSASASEVELPLPATLRAGVHAVQVAQEVDMDRTPAPPPHTPIYRGSGESRAVPFVLRPKASFAAADGFVTVSAIDPPVVQTQRVALVLNAVAGGGGDSYTLAPKTWLPDPGPHHTLEFDVSALPAKSYLARLRVDGADSVLAYDGVTRQYTGPQVSL